MREFDELLDEVLREDARVEPRLGIEGRVLARVRMEAGQPVGWWRWLRWGWVPVGACLGLALLMMHSSFVARTGVPADVGVAVAHRVPVVEPDAAVARQSGDSAPVAKAVVRDRARRVVRRSADIGEVQLPKLETFPAPAAVDMFPRPVKTSERGPQLAALSSEKVGEALAALQQDQNEPIRIAGIQIAPLQTDIDAGQNQ